MLEQNLLAFIEMCLENFNFILLFLFKIGLTENFTKTSGVLLLAQAILAHITIAIATQMTKRTSIFKWSTISGPKL